MKVQEVLDWLEGFPRGADVYLPNGTEERGYSLLCDLDVAYVIRSSVNYGAVDKVLFEKDTAELSPEEIRTDLDRVVVLWSV